MAQQDPSRTERATPKRRNKARQKGNVAKSQDLAKAVTLLASLIAIRISVDGLRDHLGGLMRLYLGRHFTLELTQANVYEMTLNLSKEMALMLLPILCFVGAAGYAIMRYQVGSLWAPKVFEFKLPNMNPIEGFKRMIISKQAMLMLIKQALQGLAVGVAVYMVLIDEKDNIIPLFYKDAASMAEYLLMTGYRVVKNALIPMLVIGIADLVYNRWEYEEQLKMTKDEIKDERKQAEGDERIKAKQKQKMFNMAMKRMLKNVPKADVVITNPTHLAIALMYNPFEAPAPLVIAKGADHLAEKIKEIARTHNIPVRENKPLAQALYKTVEVGDIIPEELYQAVAAILAQLSRFKKKR